LKNHCIILRGLFITHDKRKDKTMKFIITDNQGATCDRYSLLVYFPKCKSWEASNSSHDPFCPQGVGIVGAGSYPGDENHPPLNTNEVIPNKRELPKDVRKFFGRVLRWNHWWFSGSVGAEPIL